MNWIAADIAWQNIANEQDPLEAQFGVVIDYVEPILSDVQEQGLIEHWNHTFQGSTNRMEVPVIFVLAGVDGDASNAGTEIRSRFEQKGFQEGQDFVIDTGFHPSTMEDYWGADYLEKFAEMKSHSSSLAIAAFEGGLGQSFQWHRQQNRPAHIWLNQLGCGHLVEAYIYQEMAGGYLQHAIDRIDDDASRQRLEEAQDEMETALEILSEFVG